MKLGQIVKHLDFSRTGNPFFTLIFFLMCINYEKKQKTHSLQRHNHDWELTRKKSPKTCLFRNPLHER